MSYKPVSDVVDLKYFFLVIFCINVGNVLDKWSWKVFYFVFLILFLLFCFVLLYLFIYLFIVFFFFVFQWWATGKLHVSILTAFQEKLPIDQKTHYNYFICFDQVYLQIILIFKY